MPTLNRQQGRLDPARTAPKETPRNQGHQGEGTTDTRNDTAQSHELSHTVKPEVDLQSWAALGSNAKPSRTELKSKRTWQRGRK